ncbi:hypothetical protein EOE18_02650 [Novosphingobium umbonatum]|uniref:Uncharacterized protein n=1 Tax=Novosphingobium umbonatum TaxID=1908524 RepID=A0A437NAD7_9SPHN|nr:hypothetical protein [Novosphingobium umbonatum]RVU06880.1 hypothetical protein EOE18_02650 [Novosphingobium umbonatum]
MQFVAFYEKNVRWLMAHAPQHPDKFLHTYFGLAIWLGAALILRRPLSSWLPLLVLLAFEGANELVDFLHAVGWTLRSTCWDLVATFLWPVVIFTALRLFPWLEERREA